MKKALIPFLLVALICPAVASAQPFSEQDWNLYDEAIGYWHEGPHCDEVQAEVVSPTIQAEHGDAVGGSEKLYGFASQPETWQHICVLRIAVEATVNECVERIVMEHEVGHLTGHAHTTDPNSVMYPDLNFAECAAPIPPAGTYAHWRLHHSPGTRKEWEALQRKRRKRLKLVKRGESVKRAPL